MQESRWQSKTNVLPNGWNTMQLGGMLKMVQGTPYHNNYLCFGTQGMANLHSIVYHILKIYMVVVYIKLKVVDS